MTYDPHARAYICDRCRCIADPGICIGAETICDACSHPAPAPTGAVDHAPGGQPDRNLGTSPAGSAGGTVVELSGCQACGPMVARAQSAVLAMERRAIRAEAALTRLRADLVALSQERAER